MDRQKIENIFQQFKQLRVVVIGDVMIDSYLWGRVDRFSPEAPVPIVNVNNKEDRLGGAANVSLNLQSLGATPLLFSVIGDDDKGKVFQSKINDHNLYRDGIIIDQSRKTTVKSRIISKGQQIARVDEEDIDFISEEIEFNLLNLITTEVENNKIDLILFIDYDKGVITPGLIKEVTKLAKHHNIPTAADPKIRNFHNFNDITLFKPNLKEFEAGMKQKINIANIKELESIALKHKKKHNIQYILITLSELGIFINNGIKQHHYPAVVRNIADVSGAGDTVLSMATLCMAINCKPEEIAIMSNIAGGLVCSKLGVVPIDKNDLQEELINFTLK